MPWPFDTLISTIQSAFSQASTDYNKVHEFARKLEQQNLELQQKNVLITGMKNMITNRYNGMLTIPKLYEKGLEGASWAYYFAMAPNLQKVMQAKKLELGQQLTKAIEAMEKEPPPFF